LISSGLALAVLAGLFTVIGVYYVGSIPLPDAVGLPATTTIYYSDGTTVLARLGTQNRVLVDATKLPAYVGAAVVAAEDPDFWDETGARISRQYARQATGLTGTSYPDRARGLVLAWKLEDTYTKDEIIGFYLNTVYFGRGAYGIGAAAQAYFGKAAGSLTLPEAVVLAGVLSSPGSGRYDPTVSAVRSRQRFAAVVNQMVENGAIDRASADALRLPRVNAYDRSAFRSGLDQPSGLVVGQILAELSKVPPFKDQPADYLENGGFTIVTTLDARAQRLLVETADETVPGSVMDDQPSNLQAAAVVIEPGTGAVIAYYGGHEGTGADFAGAYTDRDSTAVGYGAHPAGQTFQLFTLAAALKEGVSVKSRWQAPASRQFSNGAGKDPTVVRDVVSAACQPTCTLGDAMTASLSVPLYAAAARVGAADVLDMARLAGIDTMWVPETDDTPRERVDLSQRVAGQVAPFGPEAALGANMVTVVDQANVMATFAAGGLRAEAHFVRGVSRSGSLVYSTADTTVRVLGQAEADDLTWALSGNPEGHLRSGRASASKDGVWHLRNSSVETAHAWLLGYTPELAMAVWVGNHDIELPLRDREGSRVTGRGLPAGIYRAFMDAAHDRLELPTGTFAAPTYTGNANAGDAG
jgi:membrane peptidoglycan carboxypeptidase